MTRALWVGATVVVALTCATGGWAEESFNPATMGTRSRIPPSSPSIKTGVLGAGAAVKKAISIAKVRDLGFGEIIAGATAGTVVISPGGARSATGGTALGGLGDSGPATFTVTGEPDEEFRIMLPNNVNLASGSHHMQADRFTSSPDDEGELDEQGRQTLKVGATLHVDAHQAGGFYTKFFHVMVAYD